MFLLNHTQHSHINLGIVVLKDRRAAFEKVGRIKSPYLIRVKAGLQEIKDAAGSHNSFLREFSTFTTGKLRSYLNMGVAIWTGVGGAS